MIDDLSIMNQACNHFRPLSSEGLGSLPPGSSWLFANGETRSADSSSPLPPRRVLLFCLLLVAADRPGAALGWKLAISRVAKDKGQRGRRDNPESASLFPDVSVFYLNTEVSRRPVSRLEVGTCWENDGQPPAFTFATWREQRAGW